MEHIDLTNFREMTDGDSELEKALFTEFFSSCEQGITSLQESNRQGNNEAWRAQSHALKGISLNIGADRLGELFMQGQDKPLAEPAEKEKLLKAIESEYTEVKACLLKIMAA